MSNLVKQSQLSEVALELWRRIKNRYNGAFIDARYEEATQKLILTPVEGAEVEVELTDLASKTLDNYFEGENLFDKLFITNNKPFEGNANNYNGNAGGHKQAGRRDYTSHSNNNDGYVDHLVIRLQNGLSTTRKLQIKYWIIEKNANIAQDNIIKEVAYQEYNVEEEQSLGATARIARVPVKMKFENPVYFIYQIYTSADMAYTTTNVGNESLYLGVANENAPLSVNILENNIGQGDGATYSGSYAISGGSINVRDLLGADGTVKTVNRQPSDAQGNVTVNSEHIPYDNQTSQLASDNVKAAIDELNGKFVSNVRYDATDRSLKQTKGGNETNIVTGVVTQWKDLSHVGEYPAINVLDYSKREENVAFATGQTGNKIDKVGSGLVTFPIDDAQEYTILRQRSYNFRIRLDDEHGTMLQFMDIAPTNVHSWNRTKLTPPSGTKTATLELLTSHDHEPKTMVLIGDHMSLYRDIDDPIPFADGNLIQIGSEVSHKFDNSNSNIKSTTVESAIKELDSKIVNAGTGTVTKVNGQLPNNLGEVDVPAVMSVTMNAQDKKKIDVVTYNNVQSQVDLTETLKSPNITHTGNIGGVQQTTVEGAFNAVEAKLQTTLNTINSVRAVDGNIDLRFVDNPTTDGGNITFSVGNTNILTLDYMTTAEVTTIVDKFV